MNIYERLAKVKFFDVVPDLSSLSPAELNALQHCVKASRVIDDIYLEQAAHGNTELYRALAERSDEEAKALLAYFKVNGCRWDGFNNDEPFVGAASERPSFGSFYPEGFTKTEWDAWVNLHEHDREQLENPFTVIERSSVGLKAVPYARAYRDGLEKAADHVRAAARFLPDGSLKSFLLARADAFASNSYFESDLLWVDTDGSPFEVTIGPYETYFDGLLGLKTAFESFVALPDRDATAALQKFLPFVPEFDGILSGEFDFKPKGAAIPLEVVSDVYRGGDAGCVPIFVAYNLPNDRRVHEAKGSKKVFSRTMMEAKFSTTGSLVAERALHPEHLRHRSFHNSFLFILCHELAHGLGPTTVRDGDREVPFEVKLGKLHNCLEEAKADMLGTRLLGYFQERGVVSKEILMGSIISEISSWFGGWRHGFTEAHSRGHLMEYNWVKHHRGVIYDPVAKQVRIDPERAFRAMVDLSTEFLRLEAAGDYDRAKRFMEAWGVVPSEIPEMVDGMKDLPATVYPRYHLPF